MGLPSLVFAKFRTTEAVTVFLVLFECDNTRWLDAPGFTQVSQTGLPFIGAREVYRKTFPAGTISIPGNNGGDGKFAVFFDRPIAWQDATER